MKQSLNFSWNFIPDFKEAYLSKLPSNVDKINIPHTVKSVPYNYFSTESNQFVSTYEKFFDVDHFNSKRRYFLRFEGFMVKGRIYLNGHDLGEHVSIYIPVEIEVSEYIKEKDNRLLVILDSKEDVNYPPFGFALDYATFGGIYREVYLIDESQTYLRNIYVHGDTQGLIDIRYEQIGEDDINVRFELYDSNHQLVSQSDQTSWVYENRVIWDLNNPVLYTLKVIIDDNDSYSIRFGFRDILFDKTGFYLNGNKVKLVGLNRHQGYPYMGYAASKSLQEDDANKLKYEVGVNVVRTSHYPQSQFFLDRCDEIGLLVVNEIPGWQHIGQNESWRKQCLINTEVMVKEQRNHPCVIAHGVRIDESQDDHDLYLKGNQLAHKLDETRQTLGVRNNPNSELLEDIYAYNDFSCDSMAHGLLDRKKITKSKGPYLVTEYMGHMDPVKPTSDEQLKVEVALRHARVIDDNYKLKDIAGAIGWCAFDYYTHVDFGSGDHICPHGALDMFRNKKHTASIYASQSDETPMLEVISNVKPGDRPEAKYCDIYVCTNCDYFDLYKNDELVTRYYPKRDQFKYLPNPPILIDDIVGETLKEEKLPKKSWRKVAKMLSHAALQGYNNLSKSELLYLYFMSKKYHYNHAELVDLFNTYVGSWGGIAKVYTFKGYKDGKLVVTKRVGPSREFDLEVTMSKKELVNSETYDGLRISLRHLDEHGSLMQYSNRVIDIEASGPIKVLGEKHQALIGGQLSLYVFSENKKGEGKIKIKMGEIEKEVSIQVK